jgi:hypothetical protein
LTITAQKLHSTGEVRRTCTKGELTHGLPSSLWNCKEARRQQGLQEAERSETPGQEELIHEAATQPGTNIGGSRS